MSTTVAQEIRERNRKTLTLPVLGIEVIIRKLTPVDFMALTKAIPAQTVERARREGVTEGEVESLAEIARQDIEEDPEKYRQFYESALVGGLVSPRCLPLGEEPDEAKNEIGPLDLGVDTDYVVAAIVKFTRGLDDDADAEGGEAPFREGGDNGEAEGTVDS